MPDPVADAITKGLQAMIAADPSLAPPEDPKPKGFAALLQRLRPKRDTD
jgi:hypothetical protein